MKGTVPSSIDLFNYNSNEYLFFNNSLLSRSENKEAETKIQGKRSNFMAIYWFCLFVERSASIDDTLDDNEEVDTETRSTGFAKFVFSFE